MGNGDQEHNHYRCIKHGVDSRRRFSRSKEVWFMKLGSQGETIRTHLQIHITTANTTACIPVNQISVRYCRRKAKTIQKDLGRMPQKVSLDKIVEVRRGPLF